ncbi:MAG: M1 family metallopeptidase [Bacteroidota bacterium]
MVKEILKNSIAPLLCVFLTFHTGLSQVSDRWQQHVDYKMEIDMDVKKHQYKGKQVLTYTNNSPDELKRVFYHLYFNAFQPGSQFDIRSRSLPDPDRRVKDRIFHLEEDEIGYIKVKSLLQDGKPVKFDHVGTILEVDLAEAIKPGGKTILEMEWDAQVPIQIRRSGWMSPEGVEFSMTQWYPKLSEYDYQGWHANPYIQREFHGVWGDFDVKITIDKAYMIGGTGYLQNPQQIGKGYEAPGTTVTQPESDKLTWHFKAPMVHDFAWAADPDFVHETAQVPGGPILHFIYQPSETVSKRWKQLIPLGVKTFKYLEETYGAYPYDQYTIIQGGDGGMEYPMATLMVGDRDLGGLYGTMTHEFVHNWFQSVLANNESLYGWMDEGFVEYVEEFAKSVIMKPNKNPIAGAYASYFNAVQFGYEEPMSTHADHYDSNRAYYVGSYAKGAVFLHQLSYIIGQETLDRGLKAFYKKWQFKHPNPNDFIRVMEIESGLELDWYKEYFVYTTKTVDYSVYKVEEVNSNVTRIILERKGLMPMPIDLKVTYTSGKSDMINIPLEMMRGAKESENDEDNFILADDWPWTYPVYSLVLPEKKKDIVSIEIDPSQRLADIDRSNNVYEKESE